ncbi:short chain dehydrogenase domain-containing protein [Ditylenchus destructor]|uniref:Short chain dehydrogenase domain-containing protein n=1 Tax=Ditylenchus destructor TaxID=166010 RepID=A0AAD4NKW3_9BILA|nr:short chain dehydrogenase domain-containing protein [Ditylenchus destructor]
MVCDCLLTLGGYAALAFVLCKIFQSLYATIFPYKFAVPHNIQVLAGAKWAVVTGSTDGIGMAYAYELAKKGFDLVLISRTQDKLNKVAKEIKEKHSSTNVKTISFDFTNPNLEDYESKIFSQLKDLEIGVLVNNVGLSYEYPERFDRIEGGLKRVTDITVVNTVPATVLSAYVLAQMAKRNLGVVVNVASSAALHTFYYLAVYSATKKYVCWLSSVLRKEYANTGITIQSVCPMLVATKMSKVRKSSYFTPTPEQFAKAAVRSIGHVSETTGCFPHQIQAEILFNLLPDFVVDRIITNENVKTRARALKKKEAAAKNE